MSKGIKIVTIGGGSSYTPELVEGMIKRKQEGVLDVAELCLVDIEEGKEKLQIVSDLAKRMIENAGVNIKITTTLDRRSALKGADFVTTQFRVGFLDARIADERRAYKFNLIGQETNGVGGFSKALRTIPVILDICKDMEEICPDAWLINFANPSGMVTEAVLRYTDIKCVGVCNRGFSFKVLISKLLGCDYHDVVMDLIGLNHFFFINGITVNGQDRFKAVFDLYKVNKDPEVAKIQKTELPVELMDAMNAIPNAYLDYYFLKDKTYQKFIENADTIGTRGEVVKKLEKALFEKYVNPNLKVKPEELSKRGGAYYSDAALDVIDGIVNDRQNVQYVNILNNGTLEFLPNNSAIECSCLVGKNGATPFINKKATDLQKGMIYLQKTFERLTIECAKEGNFDKGLMALTINPLIFDAYKARDVYYDILEGNKDYLPQFAWYFEKKEM